MGFTTQAAWYNCNTGVWTEIMINSLLTNCFTFLCFITLHMPLFNEHIAPCNLKMRWFMNPSKSDQAISNVFTVKVKVDEVNEQNRFKY